MQWHAATKFHDTLVRKAERTKASDMDELSAIRAGRAKMTPTWGSSLGLSLTRPELQRAVPAGGVLRSWSAIFRSTYVDGLYDMSSPTTEIDTFVSHSWRTPGWARALALAWHLSVSRLALAALIAPLLWAVLAVRFDIQGTYWVMPEGSERMIALSIGVGPLVVPLAFLLVAALSIASSATKLYLDRCCMCQYDTALMRASIHQLGAYIARSRRFLILWDENYCSRLWCMYEVATFLALHPVDRLRLVPITSVLPVVALWIFHALATVGVAYVGALLIFSQWFAALCQQYAPEPAAQAALLFVLVACTLCACYACVGWFVYDCVLAHVSALDELQEQLRSFKVANLKCAVESDRAVVEAEIQRMFGSCRRFESLVRNKVAHALLRDLSSLTIPYRLILLSVTPHMWFGVDVLSLTPWFSRAWWHGLILFFGVIFTGDVLGMYFLGTVVRHLHPAGPGRKNVDMDRRRVGIVTSTIAYATMNGALVALGSPIFPLFFAVPVSIALAVLALALTKYDRVPALTAARRMSSIGPAHDIGLLSPVIL